MSGRMIRELSRQQPDLGDPDLAGRLVGRAQTYYQAVEHASQTGSFRREAERMGAGSVHICVYHAFVSLHPNDKQAQNTFFTRLVSAAAMPKTTFQQGVRDLQSLLSKSQLDATPSRSRSGASSSSVQSTPRKALSTPSVKGTPESAQASAKKLLDPKYLASLRAGASPSAPDSPSKASTPSARRRATPSTPGTPSGRRTLRTSALSTPLARPPAPLAPVPVEERASATPGKRKLPAWGDDGADEPDLTIRPTSPQKRAKVRAALQGAPAESDEELEGASEQEDPEEDKGQEAGEIRPGVRQQALYAPAMFRPPLDLDSEGTRDDVVAMRQSLISALLPHTLPGRSRRRPVLAISSFDGLAAWEDTLLVGRERREAGAPAWMAEMDFTRATPFPLDARVDLKRWMHPDLEAGEA